MAAVAGPVSVTLNGTVLRLDNFGLVKRHDIAAISRKMEDQQMAVTQRAKQRAATVLVVVAAALAFPGTALAASSTPRVTHAEVLPPRSKECTTNRAAGTVRFASAFGYDASAGILDVYAAEKLGYFKSLCLTVDFIDVPLTESPYALVSADTAQITGSGSAADALVQEANGANFVGVATYGDTSDYALLTRSSIKKLTELEGKVLAYHLTLPVVLTEMLVKAGVKMSTVHFVNDPSYDPLLLVHGDFQALQAYQSNEPITLRADHVSFRMWTPAQFGVSGTFNIQVANRKFVEAHRGAVADFLRAEFRAFNYCTIHVAQCVGFLAKAQGNSYNVAHAEAEWRFESALARNHHLAGKGIGVETTSEWTSEAKAIVRYKRVGKSIGLSVAENTTIAASLYKGTHLIWP